ncbi:hypothetical protein R6Q57_020968 [Mikania cordata]
MTIALGKFTKDENDLLVRPIALSLCLFRRRGLVNGYNLCNFRYTHGLASSYLECCNFSIVAVSTHTNVGFKAQDHTEKSHSKETFSIQPTSKRLQPLRNKTSNKETAPY